MSRLRDTIREGIKDHTEYHDHIMMPLEYFIELRVADYIRDVFVDYLKDKKSPTELNLVELLIKIVD